MTVKEWRQTAKDPTPCTVCALYVGGGQKSLCKVYAEEMLAMFDSYRIAEISIDFDEGVIFLLLENAGGEYCGE